MPTLARPIQKTMPMVDRVLNDAGITVRQLDAIAVTIGPGSLPVALDWHCQRIVAVGKPLIGISTLEVLAHNKL